MKNARLWVLLTLAGGLLLHITRLAIGVGEFQRIFTWQMDIILALPMILAFVFMVKDRAYYTHIAGTSRRVYLFTLIYFGISLPLHIRSLFAQNVDILALVPYWYGFAFGVYVTVLVYFWLRMPVPEGNMPTAR